MLIVLGLPLLAASTWRLEAQAPASPAPAAPPASAGPVPEEPPRARQRQSHHLVITVLDGDDRPVAGATFSGPYLRTTYGPQRTVTDERGTAVLEYDFPRQSASSLSSVQLSIEHPDHVTRSITWLAPLGRFLSTFPTNYTVRLPRTITLGGFVRDEQGKPIAGATVNTWSIDSSSYRDPNTQRVEEKSALYSGSGRTPLPQTDENGFWSQGRIPADLDRLVVEVVRPGGASSTFATREPYADSPVAIDALRATNAVLVLAEGVTVRGIVVDEAGQPIPGVRLWERSGRASRLHAFTNEADGRFQLTHRAEAQFQITVESPQHPIQSSIVTLDPASPDLRIVLPKLRPARLRVTDENGEPISNARVRPVEWRNRGLFLQWTGVTDDTGRVVWTNAPLRSVIVTIDSPQFSSRQFRLVSQDEEQVIAVTRNTRGSMSLRVRAVDQESKQPVPAFTVLRSGSSFRTLNELGKAGPDGQFQLTITNQDRGFPYQQFTLTVRADGYVEWNSDEQFALGEGDVELAVELKKGQFNGVVLRPDGQPAANAQVILNQSDNSIYLPRFGEFNATMQGIVRERAGADGAFRIPASAEHDRLILMHPSGIARLSVGELPRSGKVQLQAWARIEGVLRPGGKPTGREQVSLRPLSQIPGDTYFNHFASTDSAGRFAFTNIPPGEHVLGRRVRVGRGPSTDSHRWPVVVAPGETKEIDFTFAGRTVTGFVDTEPGIDWTQDPQVLAVKQARPAPQLLFSGMAGAEFYQKARRLHATSPAVLDFERKRQQFQLLFDRDGVFQVDDVPPGTYELRLRARRPLSPEEQSSGRYIERDEIASLTRIVTVPPGDPGTQVDLGIFDVPVKARTAPVDPASPPISFRATMLDGKPFDLARYRGQPAVVVFWARWAPQSGARLAELHAAAAQNGLGSNSAFIAVNLDADPTMARQAVDRMGSGWHHARLDGSGRFEVTEQLGIETLPAVFLLDANGSILARDPGGRRLAAVLGRNERKTARP